jgi:hypothetical protein
MTQRLRSPWEFEKPLCSGGKLDQFFKEEGDCRSENTPSFAAEIKLTIAICHQCQHRFECAEWGITKEKWGIWGGLTAKQREVIRRSRRSTGTFIDVDLFE